MARSVDLNRFLDLKAIQAEQGRRSLRRFTEDVWHIVEPGVPFIGGWVVDCLCQHLEAVTARQLRKLVINIPPRHTKSTIVSVIWPVWDWLTHPEDRFLCASYSGALSTRDNRRKRNLIEAAWFQERYAHIFQLAPDQNVKSFFEDNLKGYQMAVSVDGATTGHGGSMLVLDDPHSAADAHSTADREATLRWFREVWSNRLNDQRKDCMVTVGQRVHADDVSGYIQKERPDWECLILPAEYEPARRCSTSIGWSDPRKNEGELLWPERFSKEVLAGLKRDLGSAGYAAQYQQSPVPSTEGQFKASWIRRYTSHAVSVEHPIGTTRTVQDLYYELASPGEAKRVLKSSCQVIITADLAISTKQEADFTVFSVWTVTRDKEILLLDVIREHLSNPEQQRAASRLDQTHHPMYFLVESVAYQLALIQQLRFNGIPVKEYKPVRDKVARSITASVLYEAGQVYHPESASWLVDCEQELLLFPKASHDDFVDTVSMICEEVGGVKIGGGLVMASSHEESEDSVTGVGSQWDELTEVEW